MAEKKGKTPKGAPEGAETPAPEAVETEAVETPAVETPAVEAAEAPAAETEVPAVEAAAPAVEADVPAAEAKEPAEAPAAEAIEAVEVAEAPVAEPVEATQAAEAPAADAVETTEAPAAAVAEPVEAEAVDAPVGDAPAPGRRERGARGGRGRDGGGPNRGNRGRRDDRRGPREDEGEELVEKLVHINRVSKTVKGGKRFGFAALVVVGDGKGRAGFGHGKAREVPEAISKATAAAKKSMVRVPLREGRTLHHDGMGHFGAGRVYVRSAPQGTGIIAGGPMRAVFESLGVADVVTKSVGTSNPYNMIRATFEALGEQTSPKAVAQRRGKKIADLMARRGGTGAAEAAAEADAVTE